MSDDIKEWKKDTEEKMQEIQKEAEKKVEGLKKVSLIVDKIAENRERQKVMVEKIEELKELEEKLEDTAYTDIIKVAKMLKMNPRKVTDIRMPEEKWGIYYLAIGKEGLGQVYGDKEHAYMRDHTRYLDSEELSAVMKDRKNVDKIKELLLKKDKQEILEKIAEAVKYCVFEYKDEDDDTEPEAIKAIGGYGEEVEIKGLKWQNGDGLIRVNDYDCDELHADKIEDYLLIEQFYEKADTIIDERTAKVVSAVERKKIGNEKIKEILSDYLVIEGIGGD